jgi:hypothetical protein
MISWVCGSSSALHYNVFLNFLVVGAGAPDTLNDMIQDMFPPYVLIQNIIDKGLMIRDMLQIYSS